MSTRILYFRDMSVDAAHLLLTEPPLLWCPFVAWTETDQDGPLLKAVLTEPGPSEGEETLFDLLSALSSERHLVPDLRRWRNLDIDTRSLAFTALGMALGYEPARLYGVAR